MTSPNNREGDMVARVYRIIRTGVNQEGNEYVRYKDINNRIGYYYNNRNDSFYSHNPDDSAYYEARDGFWRFQTSDGEVTTSKDAALSGTAISGDV
ncbi:hypothetical protein NLI96_g414 [Meripilus lineatus]|uniref:Uncharacterized protein n=1 Tax=Meripilus lineatus TaxID=2056292 RepID=A0AAD5VDU0_9APHY|nr:hypothetical protein NLI96_g414 [Physisporinus lineatus]